MKGPYQITANPNQMDSQFRNGAGRLSVFTALTLAASANSAQAQSINLQFEDFESLPIRKGVGDIRDAAVSLDPAGSARYSSATAIAQNAASAWRDVTSKFTADAGESYNSNARVDVDGTDGQGGSAGAGMRVRSGTGAATLDSAMQLTTLGAKSVTISFDLSEHAPNYVLALLYADNAGFTGAVEIDRFTGLGTLDTWVPKTYTLFDGEGGIQFSDDAYFMIRKIAVPGTDGGTNPTFHVFDNISIDVEQSYTVTTATDEDDSTINPSAGSGTSLREAINHARPGSTIKFDPSLDGRTITLGGSEIVIDKALIIDGGTADITVSGGGLSRVFGIDAGPVTIRNIHVTGSYRDGGLGSPPAAGGAIRNGGTLTLDGVTLYGNHAYTGAPGGAIINSGTLVVVNSTLTSNSAGSGGGIHNLGTLEVRHSTIVGNRAGSGGGIYNNPPGPFGATGNLTLINSIVSGNSAGQGSANIGGSIDTQAGVNLIVSDPRLAPLGTYGGTTLTLHPLANSPAIDAASVVAGDPAQDQRELPRPVGGAPDIGAVEAGPAIFVTDPGNSGPGTFRQAIADAVIPGQRIIFDAVVFDRTPANEILATSPHSLSNQTVFIDATNVSGGVTLTAGNADFEVLRAINGAEIGVARLTLAQGRRGLYAEGDSEVTLFQCTIAENANNGLRPFQAELRVYDSLIVNNNGIFGGGVDNNGSCYFTNCTFTGNTATADGGAIRSGNGVHLEVNQCTISGNSASEGGGIKSFGGATLILSNSIVAGNTAADGPDIKAPSSSTISKRGNLIGIDLGAFTATPGSPNANYDYVGTAAAPLDPLLSPLGDYCGPTQTMLPLVGSLAIKHGVSASNTPANDQRGFPRIIDFFNTLDIGAASGALAVVTSDADDSGGGTLRDHVDAAGDALTIQFDPLLDGASINLSGNEIVANKNLIIDASSLPNGIAIDAQNGSRVLRVVGGKTVKIDNLTIKRGEADFGDVGGGIYNLGHLTVRNTTFSENSAEEGGGLFNDATGEAILDKVTFTGNSANLIGGGAANFDGLLTLTNTTFSANGANAVGGAISSEAGELSIRHSSISGNSAGQFGGGIRSAGAAVTLHNTIVGANSAPAGPDVYQSGGTIALSGVNVISDLSDSGLGAGASVIEAEPMLAPLSDQGGSVQTMLPLPGSPAIDPAAGDTTSFVGTDARGFPRVAGGILDVGAVETTPPVIVTTLADGVPGSLREAIDNAAPFEVIVFAPALNNDTIVLDGAEILIDETLTIDASALPDGITISGDDATRVFRVGGTATATLRKLDIVGGQSDQGAAIFVEATAELVLDGVDIVDNRSTGEGGGVYSSGNVTIIRSTFTGNQAGGSGGSAIASFGPLVVDASTFAYNRGTVILQRGGSNGSLEMTNTTLANNDGAGISFQPGPTASIRNSTIVENNGVGLRVSSNFLQLENSIVSGNRDSGGRQIYKTGGASITASGVNLLSDLAGSTLSEGSSVIVGDPMLSPLGYYGGATMTRHPLVGSPVIDAGGGTSLAADQRGFPRVQNGSSAPLVDIGAVEAGPVIMVGSAANAEAGTLRQALADATVPGHRIVFDTGIFDGEPGDVITLASQLVIASGRDVFVDGSNVSGGVTISAGGAGRVMQINPNSTVGMDSLRITGGNVSGVGGGIFLRGTLSMSNSSITDNQSDDYGGGLYSYNGRCLLTRCLVARNTSTLAAGGMANWEPKAFMRLVDTTVYDNNAANAAGGLQSVDSATLELVNCSVVNNHAGTIGGGIRRASGSLKIENSLVANNTAPRGPDVFSTFTETAGVNFIGDPTDASGLGTEGVDYLTGDALLGPLGDYGGPIPTVPLLPGSRAIDAGVELATSSLRDGRGYDRVLNGMLDIGAYEAAADAQSADVVCLYANLTADQLETAVWEISSDPGFADDGPVAVDTMAGAGGRGFREGPRSTAQFGFPSGVAADRSGNVYIADSDNHAIRKITASGSVLTLAGGNGYGFTDGPGAVAQFAFPASLAVASDGTVFVADTFNHCIREISADGVVSTLAGFGFPGSSDGSGYFAGFSFPFGISIDRQGDLYVADTYNHRIRKVTVATGAVTTIAGSGIAGSADAVDALKATFNALESVAVSSSGDIFISDTGNRVIRRVDAMTNAVTTISGAAALSAPAGILVDSAGVIYVADRGNQRIYQLVEQPLGSGSFVLSTVAGSGAKGNVDDANGTLAEFNSPTGLALDAAGSLLVADAGNHSIRRLRFPRLTVPAGADGKGVVIGLDPGTTYYFRWRSTADVGPTHSLVWPAPMIEVELKDLAGTSFAALSDGQSQRVDVGPAGRTLKIISTGNFDLQVSAIELPAGYSLIGAPTASVPWEVPANSEREFELMAAEDAGTGAVLIFHNAGDGVFEFPVGRVYGPSVVTASPAFPDNSSATLHGVVTPGSTPTTVTFEVSTDPDMTTIWSSATAFSGSPTSVHDIVHNQGGEFFYSDRDGHRIYRVEGNGLEAIVGNAAPGFADGNFTTARFDHPTGLAYDPARGLLYVADRSNHAIRTIDVNTSTVTTLAGDNVAGFADGTGSEAHFFFPSGLDIDADGNVYVADRDNHRIRKITPDGVVTTVAGTGLPGAADGAAAGATFDGPLDVEVGPNGELLIADGNNHAVRILRPDGQVATLAGSATAGFVDAVGTAARFSTPSGLAVDANGDVYVSDRENHSIRRVSPDGTVLTVAGSGAEGSTDAAHPLGLASSMEFAFPSGLSFFPDSNGSLFIADDGNAKVRVLDRTGPQIIALPGSYAGFGFDFEGGGGPGGTGLDGWNIIATGIGSDDAFDGGAQPVMPIDFNQLTIQGDWAIHTSESAIRSGQTSTPTGAIRTDPFTVPSGAILDFLIGGGNHPWGTMDPDSLAAGPACMNLERQIAPGNWQTILTATGNGVDEFRRVEWDLAPHAGDTVRLAIYDLKSNTTTGHISVDDIRLNDFAFDAALAGLVRGATYYVRATATNAHGSSQGEVIRFTVPEPEIALHDGADSSGPELSNGQASPVDFGALPLTSAEIRTFTIANTGEYTLQIDGIALAAPFDFWGFAGGGASFPRTVPPGGELAFDVRLHNGSAGRFAVDLVITSDDLDEGTFTVPIIAQMVTAPAVTTHLPGAMTQTSVELPAAVNPQDSPTEVWFEVSTHPTLDGAYDESDVASGLALNAPEAIAVDANDNLYIADTGNHRIVMISPSGATTVLAGDGTAGFVDGSGATARFSAPLGIAVDRIGNVYVGDTGNHSIRKITPAGAVSTIAGTGVEGQTEGAGGGARFRTPKGVDVDAAGNVYVADTGNRKVRKVTALGVVSTLAGSGNFGSFNGPALSATFADPTDVAVHPNGDVFVADRDGNHMIRRISGGVVSTYAGSGNDGDADGPAGSASFDFPNAVALGPDGSLFVGDLARNHVRKIVPEPRVVSTIATLDLSGQAAGVAVASDGCVYAVDRQNARILKFTPSTIRIDVAGTLASSGDQVVSVILNATQSITYYYRAIARNAGGLTVGGIQETMPCVAWTMENFGSEANNPLIAGDLADPDCDGIVNLLEYAFDLDPNRESSASGGVPFIGRGGGQLSITYPRRIGAADVSYLVEWSIDLDVWSTAGITEQILSPPGSSLTEDVRASVADPELRKFLRVTAARP